MANKQGTIGLMAGSFDPPTLGHLDVIERAAKLCKKLYVGVAANESKKSFFTTEEKIEFLKAITGEKPHIEIVAIDGLVIQFAKEHSVDFLIRGLRPFAEMEHEFQMAFANKKMSDLETLFLLADGKYAHISSSLIREIALHHHHLKDFIPKAIEAKVFARLCPASEKANLSSSRP